MGFRTRAVAVIAAAAVVLNGCALEGQGAREAGTPASGGTDTLYFWYSDEALSGFLDNAAAAFGEREGVRIIPVLVDGGEYLEAVNDASLYSSQVPDAYIVSHDALEKAYLAGLAVPVEDEGGICNEERFPRTALSSVTYRGRIVAYPLFFETAALLYNKTYLEEWALQTAGEGTPCPAEDAVPATVEDIFNIANTFDAPQDVESIMRWDVAHILYNYWIVGSGMDLGGEWGDDSRSIDICNSRTVECMEVYAKLGRTFSVEPEAVSYESVIKEFCEGRIVFTVASTDVVRTLESAKAEGGMGFEYGIARLPQVRDGLESRSLSVTNAVAVNGYSEHKEQAERFAAYLAGECADALYAGTGKLPARKDAGGDDGYLRVFKEEYARSAPLPKMMNTGNFWLWMEGVFSKVWNGDDGAVLLREVADQIAEQVDAAGL